MLRSFLWAWLLAALTSLLASGSLAEDPTPWQRDQLKKLSGRWTAVREENSTAGTVRKTRVELEFTDGELKVCLYDEAKGKRVWDEKLKVIGVEGVNGGPGTFARLSVGGNPRQKAEVYCDFVGEKLVLVGRIGWRPWEGFPLSGEYQRPEKSK